jgi:uncharacterized protein (DUF2225 family)
MLKQFLILLAFMFFVMSSLSATTIMEEKALCPICGKEFQMEVLGSTNNFGGFDTDLLELAAGTQPVLIFPVTCIKCYFSGFSSDFQKKTEVPGKLKDAILKEKILKPLIDLSKISEQSQIAAWVKYDLIAQKYKYMNDERRTANMYLNASWAVRVLSDSWVCLQGLDENTRAKVDKIIQTQYKNTNESKNRAFDEVLMGRKLRGDADKLSGEEKIYTLIASLSLLRAHGENPEVLDILKILKDLMPAEKYDKFETRIVESINREWDFQQKVIQAFDGVLTDIETPEETTYRLYICGELYRRMGQWDKAKKNLEAVLKIKEKPDYIEEYIKINLELMKKK